MIEQRLTTAALFCFLLLAGGAEGAERWRFVVCGDSRGDGVTSQVNTNLLRELACAITNEAPEFVLFNGDLVWSASDAAFREWKSAMAPVYSAGIPVYPVMGNHENNSPAAFIEAFGDDIPDNGPPGEINRTYSIRHGNALVLMLDNYVRIHRANQIWINSILATNTLPHVFIAGHEPAFKVNHTDILDDYPQDRDAFWSSLAFGGTAAYFCGHDHFYNHSRIDDGDGNPTNDIHQYIVGTAGAPLYGDGIYDGYNGRWTPQSVHHEKAYGYVVVEIEGMTVTITWRHRVAQGLYQDGGDTLTRTARMQRPILNLAADPLQIRLRLSRLTASSRIDISEADTAAGIWHATESFTVTSNTFERVYPMQAPAKFYKIRAE